VERREAPAADPALAPRSRYRGPCPKGGSTRRHSRPAPLVAPGARNSRSRCVSAGPARDTDRPGARAARRV